MSALGLYVSGGGLALFWFTKQRGAGVVVLALGILLVTWPLAGKL